MAKRADGLKRVEWAQRLARFRARGGTVAMFCQDEGVSVPMFQYWTRRLREIKATAQGAGRSARPRVETSARAGGSARIRVRLGSQAWFSIPADAVDALACVLHWLSESQARRGQDAFQQVVVSGR